MFTLEENWIKSVHKDENKDVQNLYSNLKNGYNLCNLCIQHGAN